MKRFRGSVVLVLLLAAPVQGAEKYDLKSAEDWYDCAAFFHAGGVVMQVGKNRKALLMMMALRAVSAAKGDELSKGSDADPSPDAYRQAFKEPNMERLRPFMKKHQQGLLEKGANQKAWHERYTKRCAPPATAVFKRIKAAAGN